MRIKHWLFVLILLSLTAQGSTPGVGKEAVLEIKADSLAQTMSPLAVANHFVWVHPGNNEINLKWMEESLIGGIYLTEPIKAEYNHPTFSVAYQLTSNLSLGEKDLPGIETLNALRDPQLVSDYAKLLAYKARKKGYDHLVMPHLGSDDQYLTQVWHRIRDTDTTFFLSPENLDFELTPKRKKFYENDGAPKIRVIAAEEFPDYEKALAKGPKQEIESYFGIHSHLKHLLSKPEPVNDREARQLLHAIRKESIIPLQKTEGTFPLITDTLAIWSQDWALINELKVYYPTVLNLIYDQVPSNGKVIVDARTNPMDALELALSLEEAHEIIWIGTTDLMMDLQPTGILMVPESHPTLSRIIPEMLYGSEPIEGKINKPIPDFLAEYIAQVVPQYQLLGYATPEWVGMNPDVLDSIDWVANEMIREYGTPGAQVMVVKEGKIILDKNYGYLTYDSIISVKSNTLYDLASLTKVTATLLAVMQLDQSGAIHLDSSIATYLPDYIGTNKSTITLRQLLAHQAGLKSYLPFWKQSMEGDFMEYFYYTSDEDQQNDKRSYGNRPDPVMLDSLMSWVRQSPLIAEENPPYRYSDIGFMILHQIVESVTGTPIDQYLQSHIYQPLGMFSTCFNPLVKGYELYQIAPTEYDYYFRDEQVWGQVHDRNAAVFGGVAGHAGLFSNARDLALLLQMILQGGAYRNQQFFDPLTLQKYNQQYFTNNRRGLGWDKPGGANGNISSASSPLSFGHTGFTGTMVWADPEEELIFIFLSNRIFPNAENKNLIRLDSRRRMHELVYRSIDRSTDANQQSLD